jgi:hypothetical protein
MTSFWMLGRGPRRRDLTDQLSRLEVRYPEVRVVFADSRRFAEDWTHRFLGARRRWRNRVKGDRSF